MVIKDNFTIALTYKPIQNHFCAPKEKDRLYFKIWYFFSPPIYYYFLLIKFNFQKGDICSRF